MEMIASYFHHSNSNPYLTLQDVVQGQVGMTFANWNVFEAQTVQPETRGTMQFLVNSEMASRPTYILYTISDSLDLSVRKWTTVGMSSAH